MESPYCQGDDIEDIIGGEKRLDFTKRFMPELLAQVNEITSLSTDEKLILNQIRGNSYRVHPTFAALTLNPSPRAGEGL